MLFWFCPVSCVLCSSAASGVSGATEELSRPAAEAPTGTPLKELFTQLHRLLMLEGNPVEQSGLYRRVPADQRHVHEGRLDLTGLEQPVLMVQRLTGNKLYTFKLGQNVSTCKEPRKNVEYWKSRTFWITLNRTA